MSIVTEIEKMRSDLETLQRRIEARQATGISEDDPVIARMIGRKIGIARALVAIEQVQAEMERLREDNQLLRRQNGSLTQQVIDRGQERDQLKAQINGMKQAIDELIGHSFGVAGLHLNGEVAEWSDLRGEGRFCEWLAVFDDTPEQCLAEHDAEVIERARAYVTSEISSDSPCEDYDSALGDYANQLLQKAKEVQS